MRKLTIIWFDQFLDDYKSSVLPEFQASETDLIDKFTELESGTEFVIISVDEELTTDGLGKLFHFYLMTDDSQELMKYDGWIDV